MSHQTVAIKIKTPSGERYFYGFGKGKSVLTAWKLAGAKLFLTVSNSQEELDEVTEYLTAKKKQFEVVEVGDIRELSKQLDKQCQNNHALQREYAALHEKVQTLEEIKFFIQSEIGDFCAGLSQPGAPDSAQALQGSLNIIIERCFDKDGNVIPLSDWEKIIGVRLHSEAYQHIDALHECIANEDIEAAKRLMADFINDEAPF